MMPISSRCPITDMPNSQKVEHFATEEEWVHAVNQKAREIEFWVAFIHPTMWGNLPEFWRLRNDYLAIAHAEIARRSQVDPRARRLRAARMVSQPALFATETQEEKEMFA